MYIICNLIRNKVCCREYAIINLRIIIYVSPDTCIGPIIAAVTIPVIIVIAAIPIVITLVVVCYKSKHNQTLTLT